MDNKILADLLRSIAKVISSKQEAKKEEPKEVEKKKTIDDAVDDHGYLKVNGVTPSVS